MFAAERVKPTEKQIKHRSQQIAKWRNQVPKSGWGIGNVNARLLALALGMPDDYFLPDRPDQQEEMAALRRQLDELQEQVEELKRASGI